MKILFKTLLISFTLLSLSAVTVAGTARTSSPDGALVYIISPTTGSTVPTKFTVKFGLRGMGVAPAGTAKSKTGHHHLIVDGKLPAFNKPMGKNVKHFGGGQTEIALTLPKGVHTLQLIMGDKSHIPHNPPVVSKKIQITVE
ncbi:MAG: DUF4399 domain-containing protein [Gammaproteobacteria bacterium]